MEEWKCFIQNLKHKIMTKDEFIERWLPIIEGWAFSIEGDPDVIEAQFESNLNTLLTGKAETWINIDDEVPENSSEVLVYAPDRDIIGPVLIGCYFDDDNSWTVYDFDEGGQIDSLVTHWMPLPEPPSLVTQTTKKESQNTAERQREACAEYYKSNCKDFDGYVYEVILHTPLNDYEQRKEGQE